MANGDWFTPGVFEVRPGIFRIPLPMPDDGLRAVNVYVLEAPEGLVLVDSGCAIKEARSSLIDGLNGIDRKLTDITRFLVTHVHVDHYTQAVHIRREFGPRIALGEAERDSLRLVLEPDFYPTGVRIAQLRRLGAESLANELAAVRRSTNPLDWEFPDEWLTDTEIVDVGKRSLEVIATPGHTHGHVVFHDLEDALMFTGDHVLPTITPSIGLEAGIAENPLGDYLHSLAIVRSRPDALMLPAHGAVAPSVHFRVDELIAHHGARLDQTEAALRAGATRADEVAQILLWTRRGRPFGDLDLFNRTLAVGETWAHLVLLAAQGRAVERADGGITRYVVTS